MEQPTRLTGAEERKTGQSYLGHNTMNNQGKTSPEYSMEVSQWSSPEREALRSIRLTAAPTQKGVPVPTSPSFRKARGDGRVNNKGRGLKRLEVVHLTTFAEAGWGAMETSDYKRPCVGTYK